MRKTKAPPTRPPPNPPRGFQRVAVRLEPAQVRVLEAEATKRMQERGKRQLDVSEVVREAVAAWIAARRR